MATYSRQLVPRRTSCCSGAGSEIRVAVAIASSPALRVIPDLRHILVHVRPEVAEADERLGAGVLEGDARGRAFGGDEDLVLGRLSEADVVRAVHVERADRAAALDDG